VSGVEAGRTAYPWERPHGATPTGDGRTSFRTWAPRAERVEVQVDGRLHAMTAEGFGLHEATVAAGHGADYRFVIDGEALPDPSSRWPSSQAPADGATTGSSSPPRSRRTAVPRAWPVSSTPRTRPVSA
jgi:1,4-alpha-glucan branching enzyme